MKEFICIVCPKGCHLKVEEGGDYNVSGNGCARGVTYGKKEVTHPMRVITSTVRIDSTSTRRIPVKTQGDIPKEDIFKVMRVVHGIRIKAPIQCGDVICESVAGSGVHLVATKTVCD